MITLPFGKLDWRYLLSVKKTTGRFASNTSFRDVFEIEGKQREKEGNDNALRLTVFRRGEGWPSRQESA